jgi:hypothetical protein
MDGPPWTWSGPFPVGVERSWSVSECVYGWTAAYLQADTDVIVRIQLNPDAGISATTMAGLRTTWRDGIVNKWSNRFDCLAPNGERMPINFDVQWVTANAHHVVRVMPGPARSNMTNWDTLDTGDVASHEFGHMLSNPDEYSDVACPGRSPVNTGTVMDDNTEAVARHLNTIAAFHCGHRPSARRLVSERFGEAIKMFMFERLDATKRATFYETLKRAATSASDDSQISEIKVVLTISGGAPTERYEYRLEVRGDGVTESSFMDEMREVKPETARAEVGRDAAAEVFRQVLDAGVMELPQISDKIEPDSLIMTLTIQSGDVAKRVQLQVFEQNTEAAQRLGQKAFTLPVREGLAISLAAASPGLIQVLTVLGGVQDKLRQY